VYDSRFQAAVVHRGFQNWRISSVYRNSATWSYILCGADFDSQHQGYPLQLNNAMPCCNNDISTQRMCHITPPTKQPKGRSICPFSSLCKAAARLADQRLHLHSSASPATEWVHTCREHVLLQAVHICADIQTVTCGGRGQAGAQPGTSEEQGLQRGAPAHWKTLDAWACNKEFTFFRNPTAPLRAEFLGCSEACAATSRHASGVPGSGGACPPLPAATSLLPAAASLLPAAPPPAGGAKLP
jgi:hypothetical protein